MSHDDSDSESQRLGGSNTIRMSSTTHVPFDNDLVEEVTDTIRALHLEMSKIKKEKEEQEELFQRMLQNIRGEMVEQVDKVKKEAAEELQAAKKELKEQIAVVKKELLEKFDSANKKDGVVKIDSPQTPIGKGTKSCDQQSSEPSKPPKTENIRVKFVGIWKLVGVIDKLLTTGRENIAPSHDEWFIEFQLCDGKLCCIQRCDGELYVANEGNNLTVENDIIKLFRETEYGKVPGKIVLKNGKLHFTAIPHFELVFERHQLHD